MPQIPNFTVVYVDRNRNNWAGTPMSQSYVLKVQKTLEDNGTVYRVLLILVWHFIKEFSMGISICIRN